MQVSPLCLYPTDIPLLEHFFRILVHICILVRALRLSFFMPMLFLVIPGLSPLLNDALKAHTDAESQAVISKLAET